MNVLTSLFTGKPQEQKKRHFPGFWILGILLFALKWKWDSDFWKSKR